MEKQTLKENELFDILVSQGFCPYKNKQFIKKYAGLLIDDLSDEWEEIERLHPDERAICNLPISLEGYKGNVYVRYGKGYVLPDGVSFDQITKKFIVCETIN